MPRPDASIRMTDSALAVVVLAAGQGTRMKSALPKVLHAIGGDHCAPEEMLERSRAETARCEAFIRKTGLVDLPTEPLEIMWTPLFLRAYGGAFLDAPGPFFGAVTTRQSHFFASFIYHNHWAAYAVLMAAVGYYAMLAIVHTALDLKPKG